MGSRTSNTGKQQQCMTALLRSMGNAGRWDSCTQSPNCYEADEDACCAFGQQLHSHGQKQAPQDAHHKAIAPPAPARASIVPVFAVISACKAAVAQSASPLELQLVLQSFSHSIREQGWTVLITECGKRGEPEKAQQVFDAVPNKNVWHYSSLITAFGACGQWRAALDLLERLKQLSHSVPHLQPNHVTYSAAIVACAKAGRVDYVQRIFQEMLTVGLEPDSVTYYIVLSTCSRLGAWDVVKSLLQAMHEQGHAARSSVYQAYIRHLCRTSQWNHAVTVFQSMQDLGVPTTSDIITEMLAALNRCGKPCTAAYLLMQAAALDLIECDHLAEATYEALTNAGCGSRVVSLREYVDSCRATAAAVTQKQHSFGGQQQRVEQERQDSSTTPVVAQQEQQHRHKPWQTPPHVWRHAASPPAQVLLQPQHSLLLSYSPSVVYPHQWQQAHVNVVGWSCMTPPLVPAAPTRQGPVYHNGHTHLVQSPHQYHHTGHVAAHDSRQFTARQQKLQRSSSVGNALWSSGGNSDASCDSI